MIEHGIDDSKGAFAPMLNCKQAIVIVSDVCVDELHLLLHLLRVGNSERDLVCLSCPGRFTEAGCGCAGQVFSSNHYGLAGIGSRRWDDSS